MSRITATECRSSAGRSSRRCKANHAKTIEIRTKVCDTAAAPHRRRAKPERRARHLACLPRHPTNTGREARRHLRYPDRQSARTDERARRTGRRLDRQLGRYGRRRPGCGLICGWRGSTVRSALAAADALLVVGRAGRHRRRTHRIPNRGMCVLFFIGAFAMRGAGCTWNDIVDRDLDAKVERTRSRPIPSGQVTRQTGAAHSWSRRRWSGLWCCCSSTRFTILLGIASLGDRRDLSVPEARHLLAADRPRPRLLVGRADGLAGGVRTARSRRAVLYAGSIAWVIAYDTIYAHQDREDDALIGIKSTALLFGERTKPVLSILLRAGGGADRHRRMAGGRWS